VTLVQRRYGLVTGEEGGKIVQPCWRAVFQMLTCLRLSREHTENASRIDGNKVFLHVNRMIAVKSGVFAMT
jgi:hypothetical protein